MKMLIKDIKIRLLVSGDKEGEIVLRTLYPEDVKKLAQLSDEVEIDIDFSKIKE